VPAQERPQEGDHKGYPQGYRHEGQRMRKKHHSWWRERYEEEWIHGPPPLPWLRDKEARRHWHASGERLFLRFAFIFGLFVLLGCGALAALATVAVLFVRERPYPPLHPALGFSPVHWILTLVLVAFLLTLAFRGVGALAARRITSPLSETMKAADALAAGDLSARVPVQGSGEFRYLARSFNHMAEALETADRQRRELLADVAHELRTPLTIIQGNLEGLRDGVYEATPEHLDLVLDETHKLGRLVDDLRLLTLAEAGQLPLDLQIVDVPQLLADVCDAFACQADEAGIALIAQVPDSLPPLLVDPQRLGQVLGNLVSNALRHTPPGGQVTLGAALDPACPGQVRLWVADTGEGIPAEDLPRIFDRFWRGDPARSHEAGAGSGLGLAIAKSLVEAHGGRIWAESPGVPGHGTIISCLLPLPVGPIRD
jgi:two-component system sensor histidine kinase BaeS